MGPVATKGQGGDVQSHRVNRRSKKVRSDDALSRNRAPHLSGLTYVMSGDAPTHVLVPVKEYQDMLLRTAASDATRILDDPSTKWIDADDAMRRFAGSRVAAARKARGLTQRELGDRLNIPQSQISRIERNPDRTTLR